MVNTLRQRNRHGLYGGRTSGAAGIPDPQRSGFSLVELLVVITIIVVILSLLAPALDSAIYQAELAVCMTQVRGIAGGSISYAMDHKRTYFHRPGIDEDIKRHAEQLASPWGFDDRPTIFPYITPKLMLDPLSGKIDLDPQSTGLSTVYANYHLFAGYGFRGRQKMNRIGARWEWNRQTFSILAGDIDMIGQGTGQAECSHPDSAGRMIFNRLQNEADPVVLNLPFTFSRWELRGDHRRAPMDLNWAFDDFSVRRFDKVRWDDTETMARIPAFSDGTEFARWSGKVPRQ
jgi:prepilin-type N-terminal cleavage/methylation domain-containing protein